MIIEIKHRWTGAVLWSGEATSLRDAVEQAVRAGASLDGASLDGASLDGASLNRASLDDASLDGASLDDASLNGASLDGASLNRASLDDASLNDDSLDGASLDGASLNRASLDGASLDDASLDGASLDDASLNGASLNRASLDGASLNRASLDDAWGFSGTVTPLTDEERVAMVQRRRERLARVAVRYRARNPHVPVIEHLDRQILEFIGPAAERLDMAAWHGDEAVAPPCGTTHCRAGCAIVLAGKAGAALEEQLGPERAGGAIYLASTGRLPNFFANQEDALADIRRCAAEEGAAP